MKLDLANNKLRGKVPGAMSRLVALEHLVLAHNAFTGALPLTMSDLTNLKHVDLSHNRLSGPIAGVVLVSSLSQLEHVALSDNTFTGPILPTVNGALGGGSAMAKRREREALKSLSALGIGGLGGVGVGGRVGGGQELGDASVVEDEVAERSGVEPSSSSLSMDGRATTPATTTSAQSFRELHTLDLKNNSLAGTVNYDILENLLPRLDHYDLSGNPNLKTPQAPDYKPESESEPEPEPERCSNQALVTGYCRPGRVCKRHQEL